VKGLCHITGGGFTENIPRVLPAGCGVALDAARIAVPPVFRWLATQGGVAQAEMLRTFNCGVGMVMVVARDRAFAVAETLREAGETVAALGEVVPVTGDETRVAVGGTLDLAW
jgi:phosphoribosylformylglycinamidine cyclo-ligase